MNRKASQKEQYIKPWGAGVWFPDLAPTAMTSQIYFTLFCFNFTFIVMWAFLTRSHYPLCLNFDSILIKNSLLIAAWLYILLYYYQLIYALTIFSQKYTSVFYYLFGQILIERKAFRQEKDIGKEWCIHCWSLVLRDENINIAFAIRTTSCTLKFHCLICRAHGFRKHMTSSCCAKKSGSFQTLIVINRK